MDDPQCFHVTVKGLVLDERGAVLLLRERSGIFDLPGGRLEHGESFAECLERECREEMGVGCRLLDRLPRFAWTATDKNGIWRLVGRFEWFPGGHLAQLGRERTLAAIRHARAQSPSGLLIVDDQHRGAFVDLPVEFLDVAVGERDAAERPVDAETVEVFFVRAVNTD